MHTNDLGAPRPVYRKYVFSHFYPETHTPHASMAKDAHAPAAGTPSGGKGKATKKGGAKKGSAAPKTEKKGGKVSRRGGAV